MHGWSETEAQALRARTPAALGQALWQRFVAASLDPEISSLPAYDLAQLYGLCADLIKLVDSLLAVGDGDAAGLRRHAVLLHRWAEGAAAWVAATADSFNQLLDSLQLEAEDLAARESVVPETEETAPEESYKNSSHPRDYNLMYERLDMKLAAANVEERVRRPFTRSLARLCEQSILTIRLVSSLEKEPKPHFGRVARLMLEVNTTWHFDLGPYQLTYGKLTARGPVTPGFRFWLMELLSR